MVKDYVHGYSVKENERLADQAGSLTELLHHDTRYPAGSRVLEAGCGVGAQTVILAAGSPEASFVSVDIAEDSLAQARGKVQAEGHTNVEFGKEDILSLSFADSSFDHLFVCFVLEHLADPAAALDELKRVLMPGGTITVIEGDHGSAYFYPDSEYARRAVNCLVQLQAAPGGDSLIGRRLYPLVAGAGFKDVHVSPRMVYVDDSRPELVNGFTRKTFTAMVEGVRQQVLEAGLMHEKDFDRGVGDLYRTAEGGGSFCYTFFKAVAVK
jgi:SAM-dependent methyltransferase